MDYTEEIRFVKSFIRKNRQERLLYELTSPRKRYEGLDRFCHQAGDLIDKNKVIISDTNMEALPEFQKFVLQHNEECILLSPDSFLDSQKMNLQEAVEKAVHSFDAVIILGSDFTLVYGEVVKGGREKYLLSQHK